jgi:hypothetical protein
MKKMLMVMFSVALLSIIGCQGESSRVSYNISKEADNFNVVRQLTVINCIQGDVLFQMTGKLSIEVDQMDKQLVITVEDENGKYQKHFIGLSDNVSYVVEDIRAKDIDKYQYVLNYNPKMWLPIKLKKID